MVGVLPWPVGRSFSLGLASRSRLSARHLLTPGRRALLEAPAFTRTREAAQGKSVLPADIRRWRTANGLGRGGPQPPTYLPAVRLKQAHGRSSLPSEGRPCFADQPRSRQTQRQPVVASIATAATRPCHCSAQRPRPSRSGAKRSSTTSLLSGSSTVALERVLVDVDRRVQHHEPPLLDTEARSSSSAQDRALMTSKARRGSPIEARGTHTNIPAPRTRARALPAW